MARKGKRTIYLANVDGGIGLFETDPTPLGYCECESPEGPEDFTPPHTLKDCPSPAYMTDFGYMDERMLIEEPICPGQWKRFGGRKILQGEVYEASLSIKLDNFKRIFPAPKGRRNATKNRKG